VVAPIDLLTTAEVARYREAFASMEATAGPLDRVDNLHRHFGWAQELVSHPRLLDAVACLIGDDLLVRGSLMLCKRANHPGAVPWHQDSVYSGWHLSPSVSAWIALSPSTEDNGCLRVLPGTHRDGPQPHAERPGANVLLRRGETLIAQVDESLARSLVLRPGQMSLHHCNIIHGSQPNRSAEDRVGFIVRFVTSAHRADRGPVVRVRGHGDDRHLDCQPAVSPPDTSPTALALECARWKATCV
jgi:ectoine hydroxylase-related dioxygenase (phytanoyl-CoA dioxygenase family)